MNRFTRATWLCYIVSFAMILIGNYFHPGYEPRTDLFVGNEGYYFRSDLTGMIWLLGVFGVLLTAFRDWYWSYIGLKDRPCIMTYVVAIFTFLGLAFLLIDNGRKKSR